MRDTIIKYKLFLLFINTLKKKGIYEFSLKEFTQFTQLKTQPARRFLDSLTGLELTIGSYYKTNKTKYLILN